MLNHDAAGQQLTAALAAVRNVKTLLADAPGAKPIAKSAEALEASVLRLANKLDDRWFSDARKQWRDAGADPDMKADSPYGALVPEAVEAE